MSATDTDTGVLAERVALTEALQRARSAATNAEAVATPSAVQARVAGAIAEAERKAEALVRAGDEASARRALAEVRHTLERDGLVRIDSGDRERWADPFATAAAKVAGERAEQAADALQEFDHEHLDDLHAELHERSESALERGHAALAEVESAERELRKLAGTWSTVAREVGVDPGVGDGAKALSVAIRAADEQRAEDARWAETPSTHVVPDRHAPAPPFRPAEPDPMAEVPARTWGRGDETWGSRHPGAKLDVEDQA